MAKVFVQITDENNDILFSSKETDTHVDVHFYHGNQKVRSIRLRPEEGTDGMNWELLHNVNYMKKFIIINGKSIAYIEKETMADAITYCENYCDNSKEVIVREYEDVKEYINA